MIPGSELNSNIANDQSNHMSSQQGSNSQDPAKNSEGFVDLNVNSQASQGIYSQIPELYSMGMRQHKNQSKFLYNELPLGTESKDIPQYNMSSPKLNDIIGQQQQGHINNFQYQQQAPFHQTIPAPVTQGAAQKRPIQQPNMMRSAQGYRQLGQVNSSTAIPQQQFQQGGVLQKQAPIQNSPKALLGALLRKVSPELQPQFLALYSKLQNKHMSSEEFLERAKEMLAVGFPSGTGMIPPQRDISQEGGNVFSNSKNYDSLQTYDTFQRPPYDNYQYRVMNMKNSKDFPYQNRQTTSPQQGMGSYVMNMPRSDNIPRKDPVVPIEENITRPQQTNNYFYYSEPYNNFNSVKPVQQQVQGNWDENQNLGNPASGETFPYRLARVQMKNTTHTPRTEHISEINQSSYKDSGLNQRLNAQNIPMIQKVGQENSFKTRQNTQNPQRVEVRAQGPIRGAQELLNVMQSQNPQKLSKNTKSTGSGFGQPPKEVDASRLDMQSMIDVTSYTSVNLKEEEENIINAMLPNYKIENINTSGSQSEENELLNPVILSSLLNFIAKTNGIKFMDKRLIPFLSIAVKEHIRGLLDKMMVAARSRSNILHRRLSSGENVGDFLDGDESPGFSIIVCENIKEKLAKMRDDELKAEEALRVKLNLPKLSGEEKKDYNKKMGQKQSSDFQREDNQDAIKEELQADSSAARLGTLATSKKGNELAKSSNFSPVKRKKKAFKARDLPEVIKVRNANEVIMAALGGNLSKSWMSTASVNNMNRFQLKQGLNASQKDPKNMNLPSLDSNGNPISLVPTKVKSNDMEGYGDEKVHVDKDGNSLEGSKLGTVWNKAHTSESIDLNPQKFPEEKYIITIKDAILCLQSDRNFVKSLILHKWLMK